MPTSRITLDGLKMRVVTTATSGVVSADTVFEFQQQGMVVTARYAGGRIMAGFLAGKWEKGRLPFRYVQVTNDGAVESGRSVGHVSRLPDGRVRLEEHFQWESKQGSGTNVFEEIPIVSRRKSRS